MKIVAVDQVHEFLRVLDQRYQRPAIIYLLGGSAICLIGGERPTLDIDYVGNDLDKDDFQKVIDQVASTLGIEVDAVPIDRFVPIPDGATERHLWIGRFGQIDAYVLDPYTIALSKLDRGFDTDIEDIMGRALSIPIGWYPRLLEATPEERNNWVLLGDGYAIEWPDLDEHIGIEGLLAGRRSGESEQSFRRWLATRTS